MIKAILFDFYGTLVKEDSKIINEICYEIHDSSSNLKSIKEIGHFWDQEFRKLCLNSFNNNFIIQKLIETKSIENTLKYCKSNLEAIDLAKRLFAYWSNPELFDDTIETLNKIQLPICIVSNIDNTELNNALLNIDYSPDYIVTSESEKAYKPRSEMFIKALKLLGMKNNEVLHVGDSYSSDILGAKNLDIKTIWINRDKRHIDTNISDFEIFNISELLNIID